MPEDIQDAIEVSPDNDKWKVLIIYWFNLPCYLMILPDSDVKLYTGFSDSSTFRLVFDQLAKKAQYMPIERARLTQLKICHLHLTEKMTILES